MKHLTPLNESDSSYRVEVEVDINYYGSSFKGREINTISADKIVVTFDIEIEYRTWGINGISIWNIQGPSEIRIGVEYYGEEIESEDFENLNQDIILKLDWNKIKIEEELEKGALTIEKISIELINDPSGGYMVTGKELMKSGDLMIKEFIAHVTKF